MPVRDQPTLSACHFLTLCFFCESNLRRNRMKFHSKKLMVALLTATTSLTWTGIATAQDVDEITVTGSHIKKKSQFDSASPIDTIDQEIVDSTGFTTSSEVIRWMPYNTGSENQANALTQGGTPGTSNINLRGLGLGSTLVLINGRRQTVSSAVANRGDTFVDINAMMPMIMVDRIETLKDGASAVYGSDAVAGVVNFMTRDDFEGLELRLDRSQTTRGDDHADSTISAIFGADNGQTHVVVAASYLERKGMFTTDRDFPYQTLSSFGNPGSFLPLGVTLNGATPGVFNADDECGLHSPTSIFVDTGGGSSLCYYDFGPNYSLIPDETRAQIFATASHEISDTMTLYAEYGVARNTGEGGYSASYPNLAFPRIPAAHPGNPYGVDVYWRGRAIGDGAGEPGASRVINHWSDVTTRFVMGLEGDVPGTETWTYDISHNYSENLRSGTANDQIGANMSLALNGLGGVDCNPVTDAPGDPGCLWFNPFGTAITANPGDPEYNSEEVMAFINSNNFSEALTKLWTVDATITGDLAQLPAGTLQAAFGFQHRKESRRTTESADAIREDLVFLVGGQNENGQREIDAVFAEFAVPLMSGDNGTLDLDLAVRYTDYDGVWTSTDPKVGLLYRPNEKLSIRGSWSSSFRAPTLFQVSSDQTSLNAVFDSLTGSLVFLATTATANPGLEPEEADTLGLGFSYSPSDILTFSLDYYKVTYENLLTQESAQSVVTQQYVDWLTNVCPAVPVAGLGAGACFDIANDPKVDRDFDPLTGNGSLTPFRVYVDRFNAASAETDGFDLTVTLTPTIDSMAGNLVIRNETTYVNSFEFKAAPGAPTLEGAGNRNIDSPIARSIPQWRSNTYLGWANGAHEASVIVRYISSYDDGRTAGTIEKIDSWTTLDLQYSYDFGDTLSFGQGTKFTIGLNNATDEDPPFVQSKVAGGNDFGYDVKVHDPRGRMVYLRLVQDF
ncbi:MAG: TonB-dependent receptor [Alphaproteobacteria bacterium]|nr:MAG: TonB-dependent receptor [Alphaproteobacteria bacterium]